MKILVDEIPKRCDDCCFFTSILLPNPFYGFVGVGIKEPIPRFGKGCFLLNLEINDKISNTTRLVSCPLISYKKISSKENSFSIEDELVYIIPNYPKEKENEKYDE